MKKTIRKNNSRKNKTKIKFSELSYCETIDCFIVILIIFNFVLLIYLGIELFIKWS